MKPTNLGLSALVPKDEELTNLKMVSSGSQIFLWSTTTPNLKVTCGDEVQDGFIQLFLQNHGQRPFDTQCWVSKGLSGWKRFIMKKLFRSLQRLGLCLCTSWATQGHTQAFPKAAALFWVIPLPHSQVLTGRQFSQDYNLFIRTTLLVPAAAKTSPQRDFFTKCFITGIELSKS